MDLTTATPVEIDTELARLWEAQSKADAYGASHRASLADWDKRFGGSQPQYNSFREAAERYEAESAALAAEALPYQEEYLRRPWSRFFLVTNQNGHIHTSMSCSTCFMDTQFAWLPDYSGMSDQEIVAIEAYRCCTVCMPIAPAEQKAAAQKRSKEERERKAAERQAKKDAKAAKAQERARKLVDKVEVAIEKLGGREVFERDYSTYGHDGKKSLYAWTGGDNCQQTVGDVLYDLCEMREGRRGMHINESVKAELTKRGLI
jgi:pyruvate/2-oxoglutarate dehydrogenase complex dihydrolipoamide acyltransferase (E2) component